MNNYLLLFYNNNNNNNLMFPLFDYFTRSNNSGKINFFKDRPIILKRSIATDRLATTAILEVFKFQSSSSDTSYCFLNSIK
jgi:hypothetical protein